MKIKCIIVMAIAFSIAMATSSRAATVENVTFKDTDIRVVLQGIAKLAASDNKDINIVASPEVTGQVTIDLVKVDWETALKVILREYNLKAHREKNVIMVTSAGTTAAGGQPKVDDFEVKVFNLRYLDANDAMKAVQPVLSPNGRASVLETTGQSGWEFGGDLTKKAGSGTEKLKRTKVLIVSDIASRIEQVGGLLDQIDVMPKQILIKARILEVNHDVLKDLGVDWGTGTTGAEASTLLTTDLNDHYNLASHSLAPTPSTFVPLTTSLTTTNGGLKLLFQHVTGTQYEAILHALEENTKANTLSAPLVTTLNNQEATLLIGTKYPIIKTDVSTETNYIIGGSLQEYKDIGIQLNVVPQIWGDNEDMVNLIVHPVVSSYSTTAKVINQAGTTLVEYPIISTREAETQLAVKDGGTVMMGGLMKDVKSTQIVGIPIISKIPILGLLFKRHVNTTEKVELIIFITAKIVNPGEEVPKEMVDADAVQAKFDKQ